MRKSRWRFRMQNSSRTWRRIASRLAELSEGLSYPSLEPVEPELYPVIRELFVEGPGAVELSSSVPSTGALTG
jgi:hypothetical protein